MAKWDKSQPGNSQPSSLIGTCLTPPNFKYPKITKNGNLLFFAVIMARLFVNLNVIIIFESMDRNPLVLPFNTNLFGRICMVLFAEFIQSLEFLKKSWNLSSNFLDLEKVYKIEMKSAKIGKKSWGFHFCQILFNLAHMFAVHHEKSNVSSFLKVSIDNLFDNRESGKRNNCFGKRSRKVVNFGSKNLYEPCIYFLGFYKNKCELFVNFFFGC